MTTAYIAGKMTGEVNLGWDLFDSCSERLGEYGWECFSPADMDRANGIRYGQEKVSDELVQKCFRGDIVAISKSDAIVLLENWIGSKGARLEAQIGLVCGHDFYLYIEDEDFIIELTRAEVEAELAIPLGTTVTLQELEEEPVERVPLIIALGHSARVGKDSAAKILVEEHGFERLAFADTLRDIAYDSLPKLRVLVDNHGWEQAKEVEPEVRQYLIDLGQALRKHLGENILVDAVFDQMKPEGKYVISDLRFEDEVETVLAAAGHTVHITRPGFPPGLDAADQALVNYTDWDHELVNDGTLEDLAENVGSVLAQIELDHGDGEW